MVGETARKGAECLNLELIMATRGNFGPRTKTLGRERRKIKASAQLSTPPFSLLHFVPEMDVFTAAQPATVLHPPYYYRRYFGSHTDHSALSLSGPISPRSRLGSLLARPSSVRPSCQAQKRESDLLSSLPPPLAIPHFPLLSVF